jgi:hypothetical protein
VVIERGGLHLDPRPAIGEQWIRYPVDRETSQRVGGIEGGHCDGEHKR